MMTKVYYVENSSDLDFIYDTLRASLTCTIIRTPIEMNYSQIEVISEELDDFVCVERALAPLV